MADETIAAESGDEPITDATVAQAPEPVAEEALDPATPTPPEPPARGTNAPQWAMDRIHEETNRRQAIEQENKTLKDLMARLQKGETPTTQPVRDTPPDRYNEDVRAEAVRMKFREDTEFVRDAGLAAFPNFSDALRALGAADVVTNDDCVADIIAAAGRDKAHILLRDLAKDLDKARSIAKLSPRARMSELTRMTMAEQSKPVTEASAPKPVAISKAPPPKPKIEPGGASPPSGDDWMLDSNPSDDVFYEGFKKKYKIA